MNGLKVGSPVSRRGGASVAASFFSDSAMRSCTRSATQKHTCAMSGLVIVDSMYSDDVELYLTWLGAGPATCAGPRSRASSALCSFFLCPGTLIPSSS